MASIIRADALQNTNTTNLISQTNATTITIGASGQTITPATGATISGVGIAWQSVQSTNFTAVAGRGYWINTTSNACTITLPASANNGDTIILADYLRTWGTNAITINQNSLKFQGYTSPNPVYNTSGQSVTLVYSGATQGWIPTVDDDVTLKTPQSYSVDFLVVAGGGGGSSGGGGAGGYRTSTQTVNIGTVITITVGDGGANGVGGNGGSSSKGTNGNNSSISGSGLTTITSSGGGGAGRVDSPNMTDNTGIDGGSGGGSGRGSNLTNSGFGYGNTPSTSPIQGNNGGSVTGLAPSYGSGGGGGASAVGGNGTGSGGGNGGNGTASSITGSSITRAGGGGGACNSGTAGTGGTGGGGSGVAGNATATSGTVNTGGGGGGSDGGNGGSGGKGVVILSMATSSYSGTTTGSPTITTSGSNTILSFTGTGSYTA